MEKFQLNLLRKKTPDPDSFVSKCYQIFKLTYTHKREKGELLPNQFYEPKTMIPKPGKAGQGRKICRLISLIYTDNVSKE